MNPFELGNAGAPGATPAAPGQPTERRPDDESRRRFEEAMALPRETPGTQAVAKQAAATQPPTKQPPADVAPGRPAAGPGASEPVAFAPDSSAPFASDTAVRARKDRAASDRGTAADRKAADGAASDGGPVDGISSGLVGDPPAPRRARKRGHAADAQESAQGASSAGLPAATDALQQPAVPSQPVPVPVAPAASGATVKSDGARAEASARGLPFGPRAGLRSGSMSVATGGPSPRHDPAAAQHASGSSGGQPQNPLAQRSFAEGAAHGGAGMPNLPQGLAQDTGAFPAPSSHSARDARAAAPQLPAPAPIRPAAAPASPSVITDARAPAASQVLSSQAAPPISAQPPHEAPRSATGTSPASSAAAPLPGDAPHASPAFPASPAAPAPLTPHEDAAATTLPPIARHARHSVPSQPAAPVSAGAIDIPPSATDAHAPIVASTETGQQSPTTGAWAEPVGADHAVAPPSGAGSPEIAAANPHTPAKGHTSMTEALKPRRDATTAELSSDDSPPADEPAPPQPALAVTDFFGIPFAQPHAHVTAAPATPANEQPHAAVAREMADAVTSLLVGWKPGDEIARMPLRHDLLPGTVLTVQQQQAGAQLVVTFVCAVQASRQLLERAAPQFARSLAAGEKRRLVLRVQDTDGGVPLEIVTEPGEVTG